MTQLVAGCLIKEAVDRQEGCPDNGKGSDAESLL